jgi:hypothetical protein
LRRETSPPDPLSVNREGEKEEEVKRGSERREVIELGVMMM